MSTSRKDLVSYDISIDQEFHIRAVYSTVIKVKARFSSLFKKGAFLIAFILFKYIFNCKTTEISHFSVSNRDEKFFHIYDTHLGPMPKHLHIHKPSPYFFQVCFFFSSFSPLFPSSSAPLDLSLRITIRLIWKSMFLPLHFRTVGCSPMPPPQQV